eukprot:5682441-Amphidinium_carterae.1
MQNSLRAAWATTTSAGNRRSGPSPGSDKRTADRASVASAAARRRSKQNSLGAQRTAPAPEAQRSDQGGSKTPC